MGLKLKILGIVLVVVAIVAVVLVFTPLPGNFDVTVTSSATEIGALVFSYFSINSVSGHTTGTSTVIDLHAWGLAFGGPSLSGSFSETACLTEWNKCTTKSANQFLPTLPTNSNLNVVNTFDFGYVPSGQTGITISLTENGNEVASGAGSMNVGVT